MALASGVNPIESRGYATMGAYGSLTTHNTWNYEHVQNVLGPTDMTNIYQLDPRFQQNINFENIYQLYNGRSLKQYSLNLLEAILIKNLDFVQLLFPPRLTLEKTFEFFTSKINLIPHHRIPPGGLPNVFTTSKMSWRTTIESYGLMGHVGLREALDPNFGKEKLNEIVYGESISAVYSIRANALRELIVDGYNNAILGTFGMVSARNNPQDQFLVETQNFAVAAYSKEQFFAMVSNATRRIIPAKPGSKHLVIMWPGGRLYLNQSLHPARANDFRAWMSVQDPVTMQLFVQDLEVNSEGIQILNNDYSVGWVESPVMRLNASDEDPEYFVTRVCLAEHYAARAVDHAKDQISTKSNSSETRLESTTDIALWSIDSGQYDMIPKEATLRAMGIWKSDLSADDELDASPGYSDGFMARVKEANKPPAFKESGNITALKSFLSQDSIGYAPAGLLNDSIICAYWDDVAQRFVPARNIGQLERIHAPRALLDRIVGGLTQILMPSFKASYMALSQLIRGWSVRGVTINAQRAFVQTINDWTVDRDGNFNGSQTPADQVQRFPGSLQLVEVLRGAYGGVPIPTNATMTQYGTSPDEMIALCLNIPMLMTIVSSRFDGAYSEWKKFADMLQPHLDVIELGANVISKILVGNSVTDDLSATSPWLHYKSASNALFQNTIADFNCAFVPIYARQGAADVDQGDVGAGAPAFLVDIVFPDGTRLDDATAANFDYTAPAAYKRRVPGRYGATLGTRILAVAAVTDAVIGQVLSLPVDLATSLPLLLSDKDTDALRKQLDRFGKTGAFARRLALEAAILLSSASRDVTDYLAAKPANQAQSQALYKAILPALQNITEAEVAEFKDLKADATLEALSGAQFAVRKTASVAALTDVQQDALNKALQVFIRDSLAKGATLGQIFAALKANPSNPAGEDGIDNAIAATYEGSVRGLALPGNRAYSAASRQSGAVSSSAFSFERPISTYARVPLSVPLAAFNSIYGRPDRLVLMSDPSKAHNTYLANGGDAATIKNNLGSGAFGLIRAFDAGLTSLSDRFAFARALDPILVDSSAAVPQPQSAPSWSGFAQANAPFGLNLVPQSSMFNAESAPLAQNNRVNLMFAGPWIDRFKEDFASRRRDEFFDALMLCVLATPLTFKAVKSMADAGLDLFVEALLVRPSIGLEMYNCVVAATQCGTLFMNPPNVRAVIETMYQDIYLVSEIYFKAVVDSRDQIQLLPNVAPKGYVGGWNTHIMLPEDYNNYKNMAASLRPSILVVPVPVTEHVGNILHLNNDDISQAVVRRLNATAIQTSQLSSVPLIKKIWPGLYTDGSKDAMSRILKDNDRPNLDYINAARNVQLLSTRGPSVQRAHSPGTFRQVPGISPLSRPGMQDTGADAIWRGAGGEFKARAQVGINYIV